MTKSRKQFEPSAMEWHVLDAKDKMLGRLATGVASLLIGKHRPDYAPHKVAPVHVIVINTDKTQVSGNKAEQKVYQHYTGYPGGLKTRSFKEQIRRDSRKVVEAAVFGMLPKNLLRDDRMRHLKLYKGAEHPHLPQISNSASK